MLFWTVLLPYKKYVTEKICKQRVQPPKSLFSNSFVVQYPLIITLMYTTLTRIFKGYTISAPYFTSQKYTKVHTSLTKNKWKSNFLANVNISFSLETKTWIVKYGCYSIFPAIYFSWKTVTKLIEELQKIQKSSLRDCF